MTHNLNGKTKVKLGDKKPSTIGKRSVGLSDVDHKGKSGKGGQSSSNKAEAKYADFKQSPIATKK